MLKGVEVVPARSRASDQLAALFEGSGWPAFINADPLAAAALPRIRELFAGHELALVDDEDVVGAGWGVPLSWDGTLEHLPTGYSETLQRALDDHARRVQCNTLVLCAVQVRSDLGRRGSAGTAITTLVEHGTAQGLTQVIAPLRPTLKHRYPLTPIEQYAAWRRADGEPFDPWLRLHRRLGATVLTTSVRSQIFTGTVAEWEQWSGLALLGSGRYVIPDALAPLDVDLAANVGTCIEPGIWVQHR